MRELPVGDDAMLLDFAAHDDPSGAVRAAERSLRQAKSSGQLDVDDLVPAAQTLLVQAADGHGVDELGVRRALHRAADDAALGDRREVEIPVTYDGADLDDVAATLGMVPADVISAHRSTRWRVQFMGFVPGFGYLVPEDDPESPLVQMPRREQSRTRVPAGSVAIAAGYGAVYPRQSPGGWYLLGHTDIELWDERSPESPSLLRPGDLVQFVDVENAGGLQ